MSNPNSPFGFRPVGHNEGSAPNFGLSTFNILYSYNTNIYRGDPVVFSSGYIQQASNVTNPIVGVFWGCHYYSVARKIPVYSLYYPGSSDQVTNGTVTAYVITDENAQFVVQETGDNAALARANIGTRYAFNVGSGGSTTTGLSGFSLDDNVSGNAGHSFRLVALLSDVAAPGTPGTDNTSLYNQGIVMFNNTIYRTTN